MTKKQKTWLLIYALMFIVPEVLFSFVASSTLFLFGVNSQILFNKLTHINLFLDYQLYFFLALLIEIIGILGLLVSTLKFNKSKFKWIICFFLFILFVIAIIIFYAAYYMRHGIGF